MKLVRKAYYWRKCSHIDYRCWFVLKDLHAFYARHILYSSEEVYKEPEVVNESKPELEVINEPDPQSPVLVKFDVFKELRPEIIAESEPVSKPEPEVEESETEVEELLIGTLIDLPAEPTMELLLSSPGMRIPVSLRPPNLYDPLQIFLKDTVTGDQVIQGAKYS